MPLPMGPDRTKGRIAATIFASMNPSFADNMRKASENNLHNMQNAENEVEENKEYAMNGALALRAMYSAMQGGDFEAAYRAYYSLHMICDDQIEEEELETGTEDMEGIY